MIRIATVFSGIGAPEQALKQLKIEHEIVFACDNGERELEMTYDEINAATEKMTYEEKQKYVNNLYINTKKANNVKKSYFKNYNITEEQWYEDIRFIDGERYTGQVDILVGGSPCQSFSTYGKKKGFDDTRGTLFFHYAKLIEEVQPKVFIYENVPGLMTHDKGNTWKRIKEIFDDLDYDIKDAVLNACDYGLPQIRERVFVVGFRKKLGITNFIFPKTKKLRKTAPEYLSKKVDLKYYLGQKGFEWVTQKEKHQGRSRVNRDVICCQTANQQFNWTGDFRLEPPTDEMRENPRIYVGEYEGQECVARKMTPQECLRLMGFKKFKIDKTLTDEQIYRQSGNSIAVPVLKALFKEIFKYVKFD